MGLKKISKPEPLTKTAYKALRHSILANELTTGVVSNDDIEDVFEIRIALEVFSIGKICNKKDSKEVSRLTSYLKQQKQAAKNKDNVSFMEADRNYHLVFTGLTKNQYLMEMMQDIRDIMHLMGYKTLDISGRMDQIINEHGKILDSIIKCDAAKATEQMISHLKTTKDAVKKVYRS